MSEDASYELQRAIVTRIKADAVLSSLIVDRIYDLVPRGDDGKVLADFPYVSFGDWQDTPENFDCIDASEIAVQLHVWSRDPGFREAKRIAKALSRCLHDADITLADNALTYLTYDGRRDLRDPDGLTSHSVVNFSAGVENR